MGGKAGKTGQPRSTKVAGKKGRPGEGGATRDEAAGVATGGSVTTEGAGKAKAPSTGKTVGKTDEPGVSAWDFLFSDTPREPRRKDAATSPEGTATKGKQSHPLKDSRAGKGDASASPPGSVDPRTTRKLATAITRAIDDAERDGTARMVGKPEPEGAPEAGKGDGERPAPAGEGQREIAEPATAPAAENPQKKLIPPRPEEFDATQSVIRPGYRYVGPKTQAEIDGEKPVDFPRRSEPATSLGASTWKPTEGFKFPAKWGAQLPPGTSFSNDLSGWGKPTTSLGATYWNPPPAKWQQSIFPDTWTPTDGFAKKQEAEKPKE